MKRCIAYILVVILSIGIVSPTFSPILAQSVDELEKELQELERTRSSMNEEASDAKERIAENEQRQTEVIEKIAEIDGELEVTEEHLKAKQGEIDQTSREITNLETSIADKEVEIASTEAELETLTEEIEELIHRIAERDILIKNRLRSIQHNGGGVNYLQVLFGAQNFTDFIHRATAVTKILDSDRSIMTAQEEDKTALENKQTTVEVKKEQLVVDKEMLDEQKGKLENQRGTLVAQEQELADLKAQLRAQRDVEVATADELEEEQMELEEYTVTLADQQEIKRSEIKALEKVIQLAEENARIEQLAQEEQRRKEEERQQQEEQNQEEQNREQQPAPEQDPNPGADPGPVIDSDATLFWPASTRRVTSEFNPIRRHPVTGIIRPHRGIDIAAAGNQAIYAAETGVVQSTYTEYGPGMNGYGDAIMITHYLDIYGNGNKQQVTTFYAHLRAGTTLVKPGDVVTRGQQIATMGNTGVGTGQHLHFEVHIGGWSHSNAVNPRNFIQ